MYLSVKFNRMLFHKISYLAINIFSSGIVFGRSIFFLKYLPERDLGVLILFQSIIGMFGLIQLGLFNGGLRVFSINSYKEYHEKINNNIITYISSVTIFGLMVTLIASLFSKMSLLIILVAIIFGGLSLLKNWFSNLLVARRKFRNINAINFWSSLISAILSLLVIKFGIAGAIISIGSLPLSFTIIFLIINKEYRPNKFNISIKIIKMVLVFGFIPYLSGIADILYNQIDKFFIAGILSVEELGQYYLATIFLTIFSLVPNNINNLFVPNAINYYSEKKLKAFYRTALKYTIILCAYSFVVYLLLELFGKPIVNLFFPEKLQQLRYLFILLPGIIAVSLSGVFGFILYVGLHYRAILWNNLFSLLSYLSLLTFLLLAKKFNLENVSYAKSLQGIFVFIFLATVYFANCKKINQFYFLNKVKNE